MTLKVIECLKVNLIDLNKRSMTWTCRRTFSTSKHFSCIHLQIFLSTWFFLLALHLWIQFKNNFVCQVNFFLLKDLNDSFDNTIEKNWSYQVFIVCHTYRLAFRTFELAFPESAVLENYQVCEKEGRYHVPVKLY